MYYTVLTWGDNGEDWMSVKKLVETNPNIDVEYKSVDKLILQKAESLREGLENLYPSKFFLVVEHTQLLQNLT